jgi:parallel beta-helix repeat protein
MRSDFLYLEGAALFISSDNNTVYDNMILQSRWYGIALSGSSHNTISGNYIACNHVGISMWESSYNTIATNIIVSQNPSNQGGISLTFSSHNVISGNLIANNPNGILLWYSSCHNTISENIFQTNTYGVALRYSYNNLPSNYNKIYHNNFIDNTVNAYDECDGNMWDNGYPSGGNYWDNHQGPWQDGYSGPDQTIPCPEGDGIIDLPSGGLNPYTIFGGENLDLYPLIEPYAQAGDVVVPEVCREERSSTLLKKG